MIAEIIPEIKTIGRGLFSYRVPEKLKEQISIGCIVKISFGRRNIRGVIEKLIEKPKNKKHRLKDIEVVYSNVSISKKYIALSYWVSNYYLCSLGEAISLFMPTDLKNPRVKIKDLRLKSKKLNPLTTDQKEIFEKLAKNLLAKKKKPALIHGVTGSGKTEIYLHLAKKTIESGKSVILLVPEIVLTPQNIERFEEIFGKEVVLMHSGLAKSEKYHCYKSFYSGEKKIIVGPRSALLVPNENIGLIIIDEEQEESYKQEQNPRYDALVLAEKIAELSSAFLLVGSATPRVETFYKAKLGIYDLFTMPGRYNTLTLPTAEVIDLKNEIKRENFSPISIRLQSALTNVLKQKEQAILFLNRRGMSTFVSCRDCGYVVNCDRCEIPMIQHLGTGGNYLICHHCEKKAAVPTKCPNCGGLRIKYFGTGVEKIEMEIKKLFPKARTKRVDAKVLQNHRQYQQFYRDFYDHKFDIVIGTQILAKGFDIPGVSLVGIISADVGLHMPHFRASEKIFRLITQVSGRSGRRAKSGQTIIQTYWPNSAAIKFAAKHDFIGFYDAEIMKRETKNYPPFSHIVRVLSENRIQNTARQQIDKLAEELSKQKIDFIGPGPCFFSRLNNRYRYQIIIKMKRLPDKNISLLYSQFPNLTWDVDALNLL